MDRLLLFADDGSDGSTHAWEWISAQSWPGWQVRVLTVQRQGIDHRDPQPPQPWSPASPRKLPAGAEVASLRHMVADGDPREVLSTTSADLLVIGPRGSGLLKRLHVGSVAEALLDNPSAPLLVAHDNHTVEHNTIAVDGSGYSEQAVRIVAALPWVGATRVTLLGVDEGDGRAPAAVESAATLMESHALAVDRRVIPHDENALTVNVRHEIDSFLTDHRCDLLVVGTKRWTGSERLRLGSVADYLAHHVRCSILIVRDAYPAQ
ncbi:MAG: universal stress protein [Actinomycetota bacterium]|nr:universal stress protein [Actinomycetota bacterium]